MSAAATVGDVVAAEVDERDQIVMVGGTGWWPGLRALLSGVRAKVWCEPGSEFAQMLEQEQLGRCRFLEHPFKPDVLLPMAWDGELGGVGRGSILGRAGYEAWGLVLCFLIVYVLKIPSHRLVLITHSHGRQPAIVAFWFGLKCKLWIDICGPVRKDLVEMQREARPNIGRHVHVNGGRDLIQMAGQMFDRRVSWSLEDPLADDNPKILRGHSVAFLKDRFPRWPGLFAMPAKETTDGSR